MRVVGSYGASQRVCKRRMLRDAPSIAIQARHGAPRPLTASLKSPKASKRQGKRPRSLDFPPLRRLYQEHQRLERLDPHLTTVEALINGHKCKLSLLSDQRMTLFGASNSYKRALKRGLVAGLLGQTWALK